MTSSEKPSAERTARLAMVASQLRDVRDPRVIAAMRTVPRHLFVPEAARGQAYGDFPLPIGRGQTISQPYIVARMSELLEVGAGHAVLEVGTGCGYQAAVLAELVSTVHSIERVPELAEEARERLARLVYRNVTVHTGDGALGLPELAPFDGIVVTCGAARVPQALVDQLRVGAHLVIPVGEAGGVMQLLRLTKQDTGGVTQEELMPVRFVPLISSVG